MSDVTWGLVGRRLWALVRWQYWPTVRRAWRRDVRVLRQRMARTLGPASAKRRPTPTLPRRDGWYPSLANTTVITTASMPVVADAMARDSIAMTVLSQATMPIRSSNCVVQHNRYVRGREPWEDVNEIYPH